MTANAMAPRPAAIDVAFVLWLGAVATAIVEVLVRFAIEPGGFSAALADSGLEIPVRLTAYAILIALALSMRAGRNFARHLLTLIFGGLGLFSLLIEPVQWVMDGGDAGAFLGTADGAMWVMIASRIAHILCVVVAIVLGYTPPAKAWFAATALNRPRF